MKRNYLIQHTSTAMLLLFAIFISGCAGSGGSTRKKMPELTDTSDEFSTRHLFNGAYVPVESNSELGFSTAYTSMNFNGAAKECLSVSLPGSLDAQALVLIGLYKPFAAALLSQWAKQERNALVLNFRTGNSSDQRRTDYLLESAGNSDIPVILLWDGRSAIRVAAYLGQISDMPGISVKQMSNK